MENVSRRLILSSGNDEQYTTRAGVMLILPYIKHLKNKTIWCPFDTEDSQFVKVLKENGYKVVYSHIWTGQDFFKYEPKNWDVILSNPPYKNKKLFIKRCLELGRPWCLLLPFQVLAEQTIYKTINDLDKLKILIPYRRLRFNTVDMFSEDRGNPTFKACYFGYDFFDEENNLLWEKPSGNTYISLIKDKKPSRLNFLNQKNKDITPHKQLRIEDLNYEA